MHFIFVGDPANKGEGPEVVRLFGYTFTRRGPPTEVTNEAHCTKLAHNGHFLAVMPTAQVAEVLVGGDDGEHHESPAAQPSPADAWRPGRKRNRQR